jgi:hypothetical protein
MNIKRASIFLGASLIVGGVVSFVYQKEVSDFFDLMYTPNDPAAVANDFWKVALSESRGRAKEFVSNPQEYESFIDGYSKYDRASIERVDEQAQTYYVKTQLKVYRDVAYSIPLFTVVTSINGQFKVDVEATKLSVADAAFDDVISYYESAITGGEKILHFTREDQVNPEFITVAKQQLRLSLCNLAANSTELLSGTKDALFTECETSEDTK